jgi:hypothetical protein
MFTIKFYSGDGCRQIIREAESFTILRSPDVSGAAEITLHQKAGDGCRIDIGDDGPDGLKRSDGWPPVFAKAIIENSAGKTTEIVGQSGPSFRPSSPPADRLQKYHHYIGADRLRLSAADD